MDTNGDGVPDTSVSGSGATVRNFGIASIALIQPLDAGGRLYASQERGAMDETRVELTRRQIRQATRQAWNQ